MLHSARVHAEIVSQHFHELLRTNMRQICTFLSCTAPNIDSSTNSGIPILTTLVSSHLLQNRDYHHPHHQMTGRANKKPEPSYTVSSQGSQQPFCSKAAVHTMLLGITLVLFLAFIFRIRQDPKIFALIFIKCKALTGFFLAASAERAA